MTRCAESEDAAAYEYECATDGWNACFCVAREYGDFVVGCNSAVKFYGLGDRSRKSGCCCGSVAVGECDDTGKSVRSVYSE